MVIREEVIIVKIGIQIESQMGYTYDDVVMLAKVSVKF